MEDARTLLLATLDLARHSKAAHSRLAAAVRREGRTVSETVAMVGAPPVDPALTVEDTNALLSGAFPTLDLDNLNSGGSGWLADTTAGMDCAALGSYPCGIPMPHQRPPGGIVVKAEPLRSPNGWQQGITEWDDAAAYDGMVASGAFDASHDCWTSGDMEAQLSGSGSLEAGSWASDDMHFMLQSVPDIKLNLHHVPSIRTIPTAPDDSRSPMQLSSVSAHTAAFLVPAGSPSDASPMHSSDSDVTPLSTSQNIAASLMPAVGAMRRNSRLPAKPSDAELKEAIAQLQKSTARAAPASLEEAHTVSRAECLERYREKKLRRLDVNTIRYMKRKINADRRPRIKGRFVKAEELSAYKAGLLPGQNGIKPQA